MLLGLEYRRRYNTHYWTGFGGKKEGDETLAETACREANEETAGVLGVTISQIMDAESNGHYIEHLNTSTNTFYRMYCLRVSGDGPVPTLFKESAIGKDHVEKIEWKYFATSDVVNNVEGILPGTDYKIYPTTLIHLQKLKDSEFFNNH